MSPFEYGDVLTRTLKLNCEECDRCETQWPSIYRIIGSRPFKHLRDRIVDLKTVFLAVISKTTYLMRLLLVTGTPAERGKGSPSAS